MEDEGENADQEEGLRTLKVAGSVVDEERIGLVIGGERKSARVNSCRLVTGIWALSLVLLSSARIRPRGDTAVDGVSDEQR